MRRFKYVYFIYLVFTDLLNVNKILIGINTCYCNVGNFGSEQRLTYTVIGGEVNVAARLESAGNEALLESFGKQVTLS